MAKCRHLLVLCTIYCHSSIFILSVSNPGGSSHLLQHWFELLHLVFSLKGLMVTVLFSFPGKGFRSKAAELLGWFWCTERWRQQSLNVASYFSACSAYPFRAACAEVLKVHKWEREGGSGGSATGTGSWMEQARMEKWHKRVPRKENTLE